MDLRSYLRTFRKHWWIVVVAFCASLGVAGVVTLKTTPTYASTITFFVNAPSDTIAGSVQGDTLGQKRVNSYVQLITTDRLTMLVAADLANGMTPDEISAKISARGDLNTVLLTATVTDTSSVRSIQIAASVAKQFVTLVDSLETAQGAASATVRLEVVDGPRLNPTPVEPNILRNLGLGVSLGVMLGLGLALLRESLDTAVRTVEELQQITGTAVMGVIGFDKNAKKDPLGLVLNASHGSGEAFRQLRTNLQFVNAASPARVIVVTSSVADEGKSVTAAKLAISFAESGFNVLLMEADLRKPRVADYLGIAGQVGLTNVLVGQVALSEVLQSWVDGHLTILPSGSIPPNPAELLGSEGMMQIVDAIRERFDMVIIDSPPLLPVADAAIVSTYADGALLVARYGRTNRNELAAAANSLDAVNGRILGTVLNMAPARGDGYGYGYYADDGDTTRSRLTYVQSVEPGNISLDRRMSDETVDGPDMASAQTHATNVSGPVHPPSERTSNGRPRLLHQGRAR